MGVTLFDDASLVLIPSGIKDSKVYSVKPDDGTGDLTFSRASTATRVNSAGLIEKVRTNSIRNSSMVGAVAGSPGTLPTNWTGGGGGGLTRTILGVGTENGLSYIDIRYNGTSSATVLSFVFESPISATSGESWTSSFYAKGISGIIPSPVMYIFEQNSSGINVANSSTPVNFSSSLTRQTLTRTLTNAATVNVSVLLALGLTNGADYDFTIRIAAPQMELAEAATDWIPTTTAAVTVGITSNVPRLDYSGGATCPRLLLEPQRTNLALYSEQFENAFWTKGNFSTISANATTSPDGTLSADKHVSTNSTAAFALGWTNASVVSGTVYTFSVYLKRSEVRFVQLRNNISGNLFCNFDLELGVAGTPSAGLTASISNAGSGWYRCVITATSGGTATGGFLMNMANSITDGLAPVYVGNGVNGYFVWGAQVEVGSFVSSYIPTTTAAVTRLRDDASKSIPTLFSAAAGTFLVDTMPTISTLINQTIGFINDGTANRFFALGFDASQLVVRARNGATVNTTLFGPTITTGQRIKAILRFDGVNYTLFANGVKYGTTTVNYPSTLNSFTLNGDATFVQVIQHSVNQSLIFPTALTDAQCIELTTL